MMSTKTVKERLDELDKLRGTGAWDSHQNNLWHTLYKLYLKQESERFAKQVESSKK